MNQATTTSNLNVGPGLKYIILLFFPRFEIYILIIEDLGRRRKPRVMELSSIASDVRAEPDASVLLVLETS